MTIIRPIILIIMFTIIVIRHAKSHLAEVGAGLGRQLLLLEVHGVDVNALDMLGEDTPRLTHALRGAGSVGDFSSGATEQSQSTVQKSASVCLRSNISTNILRFELV